MAENRSRNKGCTISMLPLFLILLFLKVTGIADMSWWWVFSPIIFTFAMFVIGGLIFLMGLGIMAANPDKIKVTYRKRDDE